MERDAAPRGGHARQVKRWHRTRLATDLVAWRALVLSALMLGACHAASRAQPVPPGFDPAPIERHAPRAPAPDNPALAAELTRLRTQAQASSREAAWQLALLHLNGVAPAAGPGEARRWLLAAQSLGEPMAAAGLAWCAIDGCGGPPEPAVARRWIGLLRPVDAPRAQYLEWLLNERLAPPTPAPHTTGVSATRRMAAQQNALLARAARDGNTAARIELAFDQLADERTAEAARTFGSAASQSPAAAANAQLLRDRLSPMPPPRARGSAAGEQWLAAARRAHRGDGAPANFAEALRLYQLAANAGNAEARRMLALIGSRPAAGGQIDIGWMQELAAFDLSGALPRVESSAMSGTALQRDPTPLFDLLPRRWRDEATGLR